MIFSAVLALFALHYDACDTWFIKGSCGLILVILVSLRFIFGTHWLSPIIFDVPLLVHFTLVDFRKHVQAERGYDTSFLICNCGEFHGIFDKQTLIDLALTLVCLEVDILGVPCSLLRILGVLFLVTSIIQIFLINIIICLLIFSCVSGVHLLEKVNCISSFGISVHILLFQIMNFRVYSARMVEQKSRNDEKEDNLLLLGQLNRIAMKIESKND